MAVATRTGYVTDEMKRQFREDGVVHLPQLLEPTWLELLAAGMRRNLNAPGPYRKRHYEGTEREFVRGSHLGPLYAGTSFDADGETAPFYKDMPRIPDIEADRSSFDIVSFEIEPGDVVMFHPATLHGGGASEGRRRTLSVRFFGD